MKRGKAKWIVAALWAASSSAAMAQDTAMYRCVVDGGKRDIKIVDGEWYERRPDAGMEWTAKGCGTAAERATGKVKTACRTIGDGFLVAPASCCKTVSGEYIDFEALRYADFDAIEPNNPDLSKPDTAGDCALLKSDDARPINAWPISRKIANGMPFVVAAGKDGVKLRPGDWEYPRTHSHFLHFEGDYYPRYGLWSSKAIGFDPHRVNSYHSCAPHKGPGMAPPCGGIHQAGHMMDRRYKPEDREMVIFGYVYTFDETGTLYSEGKPVGTVSVPNF